MTSIHSIRPKLKRTLQMISPINTDPKKYRSSSSVSHSVKRKRKYVATRTNTSFTMSYLLFRMLL